MPITSDGELREVLELNRIAVVGCSTTPGKAAHEIPRYLHERGYEVIPVNPNADEIFGRAAFDELRDVDEQIDVVDVFRPSEEVAGIVEQAVERNDVKVIWLQLGIHDNEAVRRAEESGIRVVQDRCMKPEHRRLMTGT